jgi:hypothetical protein
VALRAETSVAGPIAISAAGNARGGVRGDSLLSHHPCEILSPLAQQCFVHVESLAVVVLCLYDHMHVRMLLVGVQLCGATHNFTYVELSFMWSD